MQLHTANDESALKAQRADQLREGYLDSIRRRTDRLFGWLLAMQWILGVVLALVIAPRAWTGDRSFVHPHVWAAIVLGAAIVSLPLVFIALRPGKTMTRHTVAVAQMLYSALLIHLTGGRIETHFHVFGSLAFLAFYRDWRVLMSASLVVGLDHFLRGLWWPQSVYGVLSASPWRWLEHVAWVAFEDLFLIAFCRSSIDELHAISEHQATHEFHQISLEETRERLEREVVERKRAEDQLLENASALRKSNAELEQFAYVSSHDLREPLRMVTQYVGLIRRCLGEAIDGRLERYLGFAEDGALRMESLIDDLLDYSRIDRQPLEGGLVDLAEVIDDVKRMLGMSILESKATITCASLPLVLGDRGLLTRLFQNLISNAIKFHGDHAPTVRIEGRVDGDCVTISVHDNGIGIERVHHQRIFEIFQRLHTREDYPGTGIGLAACKKIVEQHRGSIWVESPIAEGGSVFHVRLPLAQSTSRTERNGHNHLHSVELDSPSKAG